MIAKEVHIPLLGGVRGGFFDEKVAHGVKDAHGMEIMLFTSKIFFNLSLRIRELENVHDQYLLPVNISTKVIS